MPTQKRHIGALEHINYFSKGIFVSESFENFVVFMNRGSGYDGGYGRHQMVHKNALRKEIAISNQDTVR